ncbi:MAG: porin [Pseudomonadota bacterium]|jgi:hypothetical protein|uniref:porin n=1 Tax=Thalassovita sp. TaxID=1979401 RepID=UPI002AB25D29|nr:porin [Thalassovita sp.]MEC7962846.1 porin [Pseudomonadota bacterium]MEC8292255.1 porin [Pseudomonadota bacterium]
MKKYRLVALAVTVAVPGTALAEVSGSIDFSYSVFDSNVYGDSFTSPSLKADLSYGGESGLLLDLSAGTKRYMLDGIDLDVNEANIDLGYAFGNGFNAGIFAESFSFGVDVASRGVFAGYDAGNFAGEAYFGTMESPFGEDFNQFGFRGTYSLGGNTDFAAEVARTTFDDFDEDVDYLGLSVSHKLNDTFGVFGSVQRLSGAFDEDLTAVSLGGSYTLSNGMSIALEVARFKQDVFEVDTATLGFSIPLGGKSNSVSPADGVAADVAGGSRGAYSKVLKDYSFLLDLGEG